MHLRQAAIIHQSDLHVRYNVEATPHQYLIDLYELLTYMVAAKGIAAPLPELQSHVVYPLYRAFGYTAVPFMSNDRTSLLTLQQLTNEHARQLRDPTVRKAYAIFLQICCSASCDFEAYLHPDALPHEPQSHSMLSPLHVVHLSAPHPCPRNLPSMLELAHIVGFNSSPAPDTNGCFYRVAWCPSLVHNPAHDRALARLGIHALHSQQSLLSQGMLVSGVHCTTWSESILHFSVIAAFWPGKLRAFEATILYHAMRLGLPAYGGVDPLHTFQRSQLLAQQSLTSITTPAYHLPEGAIRICFADVNPDKDVHSTGACMLAQAAPDSVHVYDHEGSWVVTLAQSLVASLARMAQASVWEFEASTFAASLRALMYAPLRSARKCTASQLFSTYFCLPSPVMTALCSAFAIQTEWFASPFDRCMQVPHFASCRAADVAFGSLGDAYNFQWLGSGIVNPGLDYTSLLKAVRWSVACCYATEPVLNIIVVSRSKQHSKLKAILQHACVQQLISIPADHCAFQVPSFLHDNCLDEDNALPAPAIDLFLVANNLGIAAFCPDLMRARATVVQAMRASSVSQYFVHGLTPIAYPLPQPPCIRAYQSAMQPAFPDAASTDGPCYNQAMAEIALQAPTLKYDADSICYTDGSKYGSSITAAWVHPETDAQQALSLPGPSSPQRTSFRGELIAIHAALHSSHFPGHAPLHIMTDSLSGLQLTNAHLVRPAHLQYNKHRWLIAAIAQNMLARPAPTYLTKVRAHAGVAGNEAADKLAREAHADLHVCPATFEDPQDRGPAWVQYQCGEGLSDLDDLRHQALKMTTASFHKFLATRPNLRMSKTFLRAQAASSDATELTGLHTASSMAFWTSRKVTDRQRRLALQVRFGTLPTKAKLARWYPSAEYDASCPLCSNGQDTIAHRLGSCTCVPVKNQICARHGHAVHAIAMEIRNGAYGDCAILIDAECHDRYVAFPDIFLPASLQTSRPDIVLLQNVHGDMASLPMYRRRDPRVIVHLVEVTYTSDLHLHDRVQTKLDQHADLRRNLLAYGWVNVQIHVFVLGHTGVMRSHSATSLTELGIDPCRVTPFLSALAIAGLYRSVGILGMFPSLRSLNLARPSSCPTSPRPSRRPSAPDFPARLQDSIATDLPPIHLGQDTLPSPSPAQLHSPALLSASSQPELPEFTNSSQAVGLLANATRPSASSTTLPVPLTSYARNSHNVHARAPQAPFATTACPLPRRRHARKRRRITTRNTAPPSRLLVPQVPDVIAGPSRTTTHAHAQGHGTQSAQTAAGAGHGAPVRQIFDPGGS